MISGWQKKLVEDLPHILMDLYKNGTDKVKDLAWKMYNWHFGLKEVPTLQQDSAAKIHLKSSASQGSNVCFAPRSVVIKKTGNKEETVRILEVIVYEGNVLYKYEPYSIDGKSEKKLSASKEFTHSLPAHFFKPKEGLWYSYGTFDPKTGVITTAENENFENLGVFDFGRKEKPQTLKL